MPERNQGCPSCHNVYPFLPLDPWYVYYVGYMYVCKCILFNRNERERFNQAKTKTTSSGKLKTDECPLHYQATLPAHPSLFFFVVLRIKPRISQTLIFPLSPSIAIFPSLFFFRNILSSYLLYKIKFIITDLWKIPEILIVIVLNLTNQYSYIKNN